MVMCDRCHETMSVKNGEFQGSHIYLWYLCKKCKHSLLLKFENKWCAQNINR